MSFRPISRADSAASSISESIPFAQRIAPSSHEQNAVFAEKRAKMLSLVGQTEELLADIGPVRFPPSSSADTGLLTVLGLGSSKAIVSSTGDIETHLLIAKLEDTKQHLVRLRGRIEDTRSRVLVTGDLNGGKSTFVNALLRRTVVPSDQQPCTALFCEVVDAVQNNNIEEVHGIVNAALYNQNDPSTFTAFNIDILRDVVEDNEPGYEMLKVYCHDARNGKEDSVLHNGIVDISLIDSPGLNIDSMKTTNLMAQQEEIDVIVFVVNAENHFTLSGREFLQNAGKEKAYVFVVVNRFDQIRRTDRCKRDILKQISEISPGTYQHADQLVHFVAAKKILENSADAATRADFTCLEDNLRSFILEKRARSKLNPAKLFLGNLLNDLAILCSYNHTLSAVKSVEISNTLSESAPAYDRMLRIKEQFLDDLDRTIDETASRSQAFARDQLSTFLEGVETYVEDIEWGGVLGMWQYARDLRNAVYRMAAVRLRRCEDFAVKSSVGCVKNIEAMAESCMEKPPTVNMDVVTTAFEDGSAEAGRAAAMSMFVPLELGDFFDVMDKIEIVKEYIPSLGLLVGGLFGYHSVTIGIWKNDQTMVRGKTAFLGLSMAGVGLFLYSLSDMKNVVDRKVLGKIKSHLTSVGLVDANSERIAKGTRRVLRLAIWEFQNQFQRILLDSQGKRQDLVEMRTRAELNKDEFRALEVRVKTLQRIVNDVDLD
ncbi:UNVERIFIED_CONTAM: mitofusin [Siphonaria sp. JEL0065]|nr:mitofusin [Siphonaria sp. JEL0065]